MSLHSRVFSCFFSATCFFQKSFAFLNPLLYSGRFFVTFFMQNLHLAHRRINFDSEHIYQ